MLPPKINNPTGPFVNTASPIRIPELIVQILLERSTPKRKAMIPPKMNMLNQGSIMPDLKYKNGKKERPCTKAHISPNFLFRISFPMKYSKSRLMIPAKALGKRAANSLIPNSFMERTCIQIKSGGF